MSFGSKRLILLVLAVTTIVTAGLVLHVLNEQPQACGNSGLGSTVLRSNLSQTGFGGVRKYRLPAGRSPNAIATASDGSVWFGEQHLPGVGHLYLNGTLLEYKWPFEYPASTVSTFIWGIAIWKGCIWASDQAGSQLTALDPDTNTVSVVKLDTGSFPYTLTIGPDDALWFTEVLASKIGRLDGGFHLHEYATTFGGTPAQIAFVNSTLGYYIDTGNVGLVEPGVYSFDPQHFSPAEIHQGPMRLIAPTSLALSENGIWVAQHATSNLAYYDFNRNDWRLYPSSPVSYQKTTLPYFVAVNGSLVWFNEHYANRMAVLDTSKGSLTEFSLANPPAAKANQIDNALTLALARDRVWFTELTANYVGFVDAAYRPDFSISTLEPSEIQALEESNTSVRFTVTGRSGTNMTIQFADTENMSSQPQRLVMTADVTRFRLLTPGHPVVVNIAVGAGLSPGRYMVLVTVTDGLVSEGAYVELEVVGVSA